MTNEYKKIAFFTYNSRGEYYLRLFDGFNSQLLHEKYKITLYMQENNKDFDILNIMKKDKIDGAIIVKMHLSDEYIDRMEKEVPDKKFVFIDKKICRKNISTVMVDDEKAVNEALEYLLSLNHKKIACVKSGLGHEDDIRFNCYKKFLKKNNISYNENIIFDCLYNEADACRKIQANFEKISKDVDAIFCTNDDMAIGVVHGLHNLGYKVPDDVSVTGFDDIRMSRFLRPSLTTIHNPTFEIGKYAVQEVMKMIETDEEGRVILLKPELIKRNSCKKI